MINMARIAQQAAAIVGGAPVGDPAAIRACAAEHRRCAAHVTTQAHRINSGHARLQFEGPGAQRFALGIHEIQDRLSQRAQELETIAAFLDGTAHRLAADQRAHRAQLERVKSNLVETATRAARAAGR